MGQRPVKLMALNQSRWVTWINATRLGKAAAAARASGAAPSIPTVKPVEAKGTVWLPSQPEAEPIGTDTDAKMEPSDEVQQKEEGVMAGASEATAPSIRNTLLVALLVDHTRVSGCTA